MDDRSRGSHVICTVFETCSLRELIALSAFAFERAARNIFFGLCFANWSIDSFPSPAFPRNVMTLPRRFWWESGSLTYRQSPKPLCLTSLVYLVQDQNSLLPYNCKDLKIL